MASYYDTEMENQNKTKAVNIALPILAALEAVGTSIATKGRNPTSNALGLYKDVQSAREAALERAVGRDKAKADTDRDTKLLGFQEAEAGRRKSEYEREGKDREAEAARIGAIKRKLLGTPAEMDPLGVEAKPAVPGVEGLTDLDKAAIEADPVGWLTNKLKPQSVNVLAGEGGFFTMPKAGGVATPVQTAGGTTVKPPPPKPTMAGKTPEQIEAEAAARARGAASVPKVLSAEDQNVVKMKLASLGTARRQLAAVKAAAKAANESMLSGKGRGWIPTKENAAFEKATAALKPTIQAMTRVPGVGAMSDFESRLAMAPYPEPGEYGEVNEQAIAGLESLINEIEGGYRGMSGGGVTGKPVTPRQGAAPAAADPRKALAQQALNDPEATEQEKAAARKILGMP